MTEIVVCPCCWDYDRDETAAIGDSKYRMDTTLANDSDGRCRLCGHNYRFGIQGTALPEVAAAYRLGGIFVARAVPGWKLRFHYD